MRVRFRLSNKMDSARFKEVSQALSSLFRRQAELLCDHPAIAERPDDRALEYKNIIHEIHRFQDELRQLK